MPVLNTASLPDLIFTVLFFFMMVTHMRSVPLKVKYKVPQGTELTRLAKKSAVLYIYIGTPQVANGSGQSGETYIQLNDKYASPADIVDYIIAERATMSSEDKANMVVSVKADRGTRMGVIDEVRQALRQAGVKRISFSATGHNDKLMQNYK